MSCVVGFNISILLRLSGLDIFDGDTGLYGPCSQSCADIFAAVTNPDCIWFAAPFDDAVQRSCDAPCWQGKNPPQCPNLRG